MPRIRASDWDARYAADNLPWDSGEVDHNLIEMLDFLKLPPGSALEIGCGTGSNAIALARYGFAPVIATDIATRAVEAARQKVKAAGVNVIVHIHDILSTSRIPDRPTKGFDFVFDRGVFHSMRWSRAHRVLFAERVAALLCQHGWWLSFCGNADDKSPGGPPRLSVAEISSIVEPLFEVHLISRGKFRHVIGEPAELYLNWRVLLCKP